MTVIMFPNTGKKTLPILYRRFRADSFSSVRPYNSVAVSMRFPWSLVGVSVAIVNGQKQKNKKAKNNLRN